MQTYLHNRVIELSDEMDALAERKRTASEEELELLHAIWKEIDDELEDVIHMLTDLHDTVSVEANGVCCNRD